MNNEGRSDRAPPTELVDRAQMGSRSALERVLAWCRPALRARAWGRVNRQRNTAVDPSDLVQDVLLVASKKVHEFQGRGPRAFLAWLLGIMKKRALQLNRFRGLAAVDPHGLQRGSGHEAAWDPLDPATPVPEQAAAREIEERLSRAESWCRDEERELIRLRNTENLSHEEIAARLGVQPPAVRKRYSRAVHQLGQALRLIECMDRHRIEPLVQDAIGLCRFQKLDASAIATRLQIRPEAVQDWLAEYREFLDPTRDDAP